MLGVGARRELAGRDPSRDGFDEALSADGREPALEFPQPRVALRTFNQGGYASRERRVDRDLGYMFHQPGDSLPGRPGRDVRHHVLVRGLESIRDQIELVVPVPVDRRLPDARSGRDGLDRERAVPGVGELGQGGLADDAPGSLDPRIEGPGIRPAMPRLCGL